MQYTMCVKRVMILFLILWAVGGNISLYAAPMGFAPNMPETPGMADLYTLLRDLAGQRAHIIDIQNELVPRPVFGPEAGGAGEESKASWLWRLFKEKNLIHMERLDLIGRVKNLTADQPATDIRPNIIVWHPGRQGMEKGPTLWVICHLHVAPAGDESAWASSPWKLRVEGDSVYGRGVMDNYQSIAAAILVMESLARHNMTPPMNFGLVLHSQNAGISHVLASKPELFKENDIILVSDYGVPDGGQMGIAEKGLLWLKVQFKGTAQHAAYSTTSDTPLGVGSRFIASVPEFMRTAFHAENPLFTIPFSTCTATKAETVDNMGLNSVAGAYSVHLDCRFIPEYTPEDIKRGITEHIAAMTDIANVTIEELAAPPSFAATPAHSASVQKLRTSIRAQHPTLTDVKLVGINTKTAAAFFRERGIHAVTWAKMDISLRHAPNEHAHIKDHLDEAAVMARTLFQP